MVQAAEIVPEWPVAPLRSISVMFAVVTGLLALIVLVCQTVERFSINAEFAAGITAPVLIAQASPTAERSLILAVFAEVMAVHARTVLDSQMEESS